MAVLLIVPDKVIGLSEAARPSKVFADSAGLPDFMSIPSFPAFDSERPAFDEGDGLAGAGRIESSRTRFW
jgi:hypothetical protein